MSKSIKGCIGHSFGEYNPESIKAQHDKVVLKIINLGKHRILEGGIIVPEDAEINNRLGFYEIISLGDKAKDEYGLKVGEYVYADRLSVFYDTNPICIMKYENIICRADETGKKLSPLKNAIFVDDIKQDDVYKDDTNLIFLASTSAYIPRGTITEMNIDEKKYPYLKIGDVIILTDGADKCTINCKTFRIYKPEMIIAKFEEGKED